MELMVVIVIIGLVSSVIAYNVRGSLNRGRKFRTEQALDKLEDTIALWIPASHIDRLVKNPVQVLSRECVIKNAESIVLDGWGTMFTFSKEGANGIKIQSKTDPEQARVIELAEAAGSGCDCPVPKLVREVLDKVPLFRKK